MPSFAQEDVFVFSPECEEHNSLRETVLMEGLCPKQGHLGSTIASPLGRSPRTANWEAGGARAYGKNQEDISVLRQDIKDLKASCRRQQGHSEPEEPGSVPLSYKRLFILVWRDPKAEGHWCPRGIFTAQCH